MTNVNSNSETTIFLHNDRWIYVHTFISRRTFRSAYSDLRGWQANPWWGTVLYQRNIFIADKRTQLRISHISPSRPSRQIAANSQILRTYSLALAHSHLLSQILRQILTTWRLCRMTTRLKLINGRHRHPISHRSGRCIT